MIKITKGSSAHYCNACIGGEAVAELEFQRAGTNFSHSISLCRKCLSELADVSGQANIAIERAAAARDFAGQNRESEKP